jgi:hypothetical protein
VIVVLLFDWSDMAASNSSDTSLQCKHGQPIGINHQQYLPFSHTQHKENTQPKNEIHGQLQMNTQLQKTRPAETTNEDHAPTRKSRLGKIEVLAPEDHTQQDGREGVQLKKTIKPSTRATEKNAPSGQICK